MSYTLTWDSYNSKGYRKRLDSVTAKPTNSPKEIHNVTGLETSLTTSTNSFAFFLMPKESDSTHLVRQSKSINPSKHYQQLKSHHCAKGDGSGGVVVDGNEVDEERCPTDKRRNEKGAHEHLLDPHLAWGAKD